MKRLSFCLLALLLALPWQPAIAGTDCTARPASAEALAAAAATALRTRDALEANGAAVALLARVGADLERYGLVYSHLGFVVRDHPDGRWTVVHLLNRCGTDRSALHAEGLVNYYADDLVGQDTRIVWLAPDYAQQVLRRLDSEALFDLHQRRYSVIARPDSRDYQNSTAWMLEVLAAARLPQPKVTRVQAQASFVASGHRSDPIEIPYGKRVLGGLFSANAAFGDHAVSTRLAGRYPVVTVRSILRWLADTGSVAAEREWRGGAERVPGPA